MKIITYLDWPDAVCECGKKISGRYCSGEEFGKFIKEHKKCSEGEVTRHYDPKDALKVCVDVPESHLETHR